MMIKVCGITNREDALAAAEGGATALGFNFYPASPRFVEPARAAELGAGLPGGVWKVGVFVNEPASRILETARLAAVDVVQLHGASGLPAGTRAWRALSAGPGFSPASLEEAGVEAFLLDAPAGTLYGGSGRTFDWRLAAGLGRKIIVAGGLDASNVAEAIRTARPWGVDACSRIEAAPGRKDHARMAAFLAAARRAAGDERSAPER